MAMGVPSCLDIPSCSRAGGRNGLQQVASTDMTVEDGVLVAKTGDGARRLFPGKPTRVPTPAPSSFVPVPVKTASAEFFLEEVRPGYSTFQPRGAGKELVFKPTPTNVKDITTINRTELEEDGDDGEEGEFCLPCEQVREIAKRFSEGWAGPFVADTEDGSFAFTVTAWSANLLSVKGQGLPFEADLYYDEDGADETCCGSFVYHDQTTTDSDSESRRLSATEEQAPERGEDDVDGDESDEDDGDEMVPAQKRHKGALAVPILITGSLRNVCTKCLHIQKCLQWCVYKVLHRSAFGDRIRL